MPPVLHTTAPVSGDRLARARVRFLTSEPVDPDEVRDPILASWWRSREWQVPADHLELPYVDDRDPETPLIRGAQPVLHRLREQLDGQPISLILTDQAGVVVSQVTGDPELRRHLDQVQLVPGFSYAEEFVGTNGIGTALEGGGPMHVFGHEHYAENLEDLACAGVPIRHPITGKTIGAVDLTCWRKDAGPLLIALAKTAADEIHRSLLSTSSMREMELFQAYLQASRRTTGIVLALNENVVMMNDCARQLLDPADQAVLLGHATDALAHAETAVMIVDLPTGNKARMYCKTVHGRSRPVGGVVHVKLIEPGDDNSAGVGPVLRMFLPGLVGFGPLWLRCCHEVDHSYGVGEWLVLAGESGVGKLALARAVHQRRNPTGRLRILDAADAVEPRWLDDARRELTVDAPDAVVIRHVDRLDPAQLNGVADALAEVKAAGNGPWVAVTLTQEGDADPELSRLLQHFPSTVNIPPLRHHAEDLRELVPFFLNRLCRGGQLTCSPEAMQLLMRSNWAGNVAQLYQVLKEVAQHRRRVGAIHSNDLPAEYRTVTRRQLSRLESMERDAIVQSLQDADGNKGMAAKALGISRATIYRKIHEYGIVAPPS